MRSFSSLLAGVVGSGATSAAVPVLSLMTTKLTVLHCTTGLNRSTSRIQASVCSQSCSVLHSLLAPRNLCF
jgi:hypothetical protein